MQIYLIYFLQGHYFLDLQYLYKMVAQNKLRTHDVNCVIFWIEFLYEVWSSSLWKRHMPCSDRKQLNSVNEFNLIPDSKFFTHLNHQVINFVENSSATPWRATKLGLISNQSTLRSGNRWTPYQSGWSSCGECIHRIWKHDLTRQKKQLPSTHEDVYHTMA